MPESVSGPLTHLPNPRIHTFLIWYCYQSSTSSLWGATLKLKYYAMLPLLQSWVFWRPSLPRMLWAPKSQVSSQSTSHDFLWFRNPNSRWGSRCALSRGLSCGVEALRFGRREACRLWRMGGNRPVSRQRELPSISFLSCFNHRVEIIPGWEEECGGNSGSLPRLWKTKYQLYLSIYLFSYIFIKVYYSSKYWFSYYLSSDLLAIL